LQRKIFKQKKSDFHRIKKESSTAYQHGFTDNRRFSTKFTGTVGTADIYERNKKKLYNQSFKQKSK